MKLEEKAVIFDLDGVICFTDKYHYQAWKALADKLGIYFDEYSYRPALGHDHGNDEKNDGNQKDVGDSDQCSAHTGTVGKRVWNLCICKTGYCFVSVLTEYVCVF